MGGLPEVYTYKENKNKLTQTRCCEIVYMITESLKSENVSRQQSMMDHRKRKP